MNKPWRTMPSGRMNPAQARKLMFCLYVVAAFISWKIGGLTQCLALMALGRLSPARSIDVSLMPA